MNTHHPLTQTQLMTFNAITGFVAELNWAFGKQQHSLALYSRLIEHMNLSNTNAIKKTVDSFNSYISKNQSAIEAREEGKLSSDKIMYSDRVYINLTPLFRIADAETKGAMWRHLLTIYGVLYPDSQAKDILRKINTTEKTSESALISDMVNKIVPHLNTEETNPMQAIMGLMSSGVFTELIGSMQKGMDEGNIDMNKLMGQVTTMFSQTDPTAKLPAQIVECSGTGSSDL
jgi:hypothetical protein